MAARLHYDGNTYVDVDSDAMTVIDRLKRALDSDGGILLVMTETGPVSLVVGRAIPIAVEEYEPVPE